MEGKRPYYSPEELIYAQPISINPVGKPIPTIPIKGVRGIGGYGPPKPLPYPSTRPHPPGKYPSLQNKYPYPGSSNSFSPQGSHQIQQGGPNYFQQGKPPRRHFGVPPSKPFYGKPSGLNGEVYEGAEFFGSKPPSFIPGANEFSQPLEPEPYKYVQQSAGQFAHINKDKRVEITVNAQGGTTATVGGVTPGKLQKKKNYTSVANYLFCFAFKQIIKFKNSLLILKYIFYNSILYSPVVFSTSTSIEDLVDNSNKFLLFFIMTLCGTYL